MLKTITKPIATFLKSEIAIGISLIVATIAAMLIANSENYEIYKIFPERNDSIFLSLKCRCNDLSREILLDEVVAYIN